ncbi:LysR family transcriptional regulator [Anaerosporobacter faecicola]|uniref:LysR family transcriptional regulator n=1 Tax=Anaerosporobacter faecicola TaxID=2718714 RepID=UPI00143B2C67|nr:LysR family transcriptional regulator [Anaerosporobacter faecicola]
MDINYELYKVFYFVGKTLSFSEASKELFISQSAVSQSIKVLEKRLNQTLFIRSTKRVKLTKEGEMLFKHIEPAINLISRGESQIMEAGTLNGGQLRIGASDTICRYYLVPFLNDFHQKYPKVHIKVTNGTSLQCVELLETNQVDLIVVNSPNSRLNSINNVTEVGTFRDVFIANKNYFPTVDREMTLTDLRNYPILMLDKHSTTSEFLHSLFLQQSIDLAPAIELNSNDLLIDMARIGLGVAFVPDYCVNNLKHQDNDDMIILNMKEELPMRKLVAAYSNQIPLTAASQYFLDQLAGQE